MTRLLILVVTIASFLSIGNVAVAQQAFEFKLGFKALADQLPANIVGTPIENEHFNLFNGNSEQHTTKGLMVWRKADNWTAYTNGYMTWVNGPNGVQSRFNGDRFPWESDISDAQATQVASPSTPRLTATDTQIKGEIDSPKAGETVQGLLMITGWAVDTGSIGSPWNGIDDFQVSLAASGGDIPFQSYRTT